LVMGGSLGAASINQAVLSALPQWEAAQVQLIWQTGSTDAQRFADAALPYKFVHVAPFIREMETAYAAADIIVSRAGAMAVTEITVVGKPAILVPYPLAAEDHQTANAQTLVNAGAAILLPDHQVGKQLEKAVLDLAANAPKRQAMAAAAQPLAITDADQRIAQHILSHLK
jgi:UDP-N-acetylglucosamine--N-acetylmuramyl-(pentapeptide) pyrophosphoryl-undecaprenol N-acetylglucosamine transferase